MNLAKFIDHTNLKQDAKEEDIIRLCEEAVEYGFASVCINPNYIPLAKKMLENSDVMVCTVIGFPLGQNTTEVKAFETENAIALGADEIDMVINVGRLKNGEGDYILNEIRAVREKCLGHTLKVIIECCLLNDEEKKIATELVKQSDADFVKTSTGFSTGGATFEDVALLCKVADGKIQVKAAGGIRTHADLMKMISLGADRIGTSSGIRLLQED